MLVCVCGVVGVLTRTTTVGAAPGHQHVEVEPVQIEGSLETSYLLDQVMCHSRELGAG